MVVRASADRTGSRAAGYVDHVAEKRSLAMRVCEELSYVRLQADNSLMVSESLVCQVPGSTVTGTPGGH